MFVNKVEVLNMARAMARHAAGSQSIIARNIANADTPGYRAAQLPAFAEIWAGRGMAMRSSRPGHTPAPGEIIARPEPNGINSSPNANSVSLESELVKAAGARQSHDMALAIYRSLSGAIRTSLGRR